MNTTLGPRNQFPKSTRIITPKKKKHETLTNDPNRESGLKHCKEQRTNVKYI